MPYILYPYEFSVQKNFKRFKYIVKNEGKIEFNDLTKISPLDLGERSGIGKHFIHFIKKATLNEYYAKPQHEQELIIHQKFVDCKNKLNNDLQSKYKDFEEALRAKKKR